MIQDHHRRQATIDGHRNGFRRNFTTMLEDLDYAGDIVLLPSKHDHLQEKTNRLVENAGRVGLKVNTAAKCKAMRMSKQAAVLRLVSDRRSLTTLWAL